MRHEWLDPGANQWLCRRQGQPFLLPSFQKGCCEINDGESATEDPMFPLVLELVVSVGHNRGDCLSLQLLQCRPHKDHWSSPFYYQPFKVDETNNTMSRRSVPVLL